MIRQTAAFCFAMLSILVLSGCSTLYSPVGKTLNAYAEDVAIADFLTYRDVDLLCQSGGSLAPLINSFQKVNAPTHKTSIALLLLGGFCEEQQAHRYEVLQLMADHGGDYQGAINFAVLKKRSLALAAKRQYKSYQDMLVAYPLNENGCPEFDSRQDELLFLLGNLQGLEALLNDGKSGLLANVPRNIANHIYRGMNCIANDTWWGAPLSVQAALLGFLPNLDREKSTRTDELLASAIAMGRKQNVPLAETVALAAWEGKGDTTKIEQLMKSHFEYAQNAQYNERWLSVSYISNRHLENKNDVMRLAARKALTADPGEPFMIQDEPEIELDLDDI